MGRLRSIFLVLCVIANGNVAVLLICSPWLVSSAADQEYQEVPQSLIEDDDDDGVDDAVIADLLPAPGCQLSVDVSALPLVDDRQHHDRLHPLLFDIGNLRI